MISVIQPLLKEFCFARQYSCFGDAASSEAKFFSFVLKGGSEFSCGQGEALASGKEIKVLDEV